MNLETKRFEKLQTPLPRGILDPSFGIRQLGSFLLPAEIVNSLLPGLVSSFAVLSNSR
jgi:hypothetical protein